MTVIRKIALALAVAAGALVGANVAGVLAQSAIGHSVPNYSDPQGLHVGATLEILPGGTFRLGTGGKTAAAVAGAATLNNLSGVVTSEPLTTAGGSTYTLTIADSAILPTDIVMASTALGSATAGLPHVETVTPGTGTLTIVIRNATGSAALNGTVTIAFADIRA